MGTLIRLAARRRRAAGAEKAAGSNGGLATRGARLLLSALALGLAAASCSGSAPQPATFLQVGPCKGHWPTARCGTLTVPENWLTGNGRRIKISFVVFPAYGHPRAPDPVVYFAGGPGSSAIGDITDALSRLTGVNRSRDLVFIDQRGTGASNGLSCPQPPGAPAGRPGIRRSIESCLHSLRGKADLRFYTTAMAADDAAHVLSALHYGTVNVYGGSYGVTTAQVFLQLFPGRVRTMTLLSGSLLSVPLFERFPQASQQALDAVFARCASTPACHRAFPHLAAEWARLRASAAANPLTLPARRSPAGVAIRFDSDLVAKAIHSLLTTADNTVKIPLVIHTLAAAGNQESALAAAARQLAAAGALTSGGTAVISYPIRCAEPWARLQPAQLTGDAHSYRYQASLHDAQWWQYACTLIPAPGAAARYGSQTTSRVPVLMLNGSADPQDPPANMAGARKIWPNSRLIIEPGQAHGVSLSAWAQCDLGLVQAFIEHADASKINVGCLSQVALPPFQLRW